MVTPAGWPRRLKLNRQLQHGGMSLKASELSAEFGPWMCQPWQEGDRQQWYVSYRLLPAIGYKAHVLILRTSREPAQPTDHPDDEPEEVRADQGSASVQGALDGQGAVPSRRERQVGIREPSASEVRGPVQGHGPRDAGVQPPDETATGAENRPGQPGDRAGDVPHHLELWPWNGRSRMTATGPGASRRSARS
jgi:hypothetical protein